MKDLIHKLAKTVSRPEGERREPRLTFAAFGKHPGWDDHIPGIGLETETLANIKQTLYGGIGREIDAGAWEKLEAEKRVEGFDHVFLWLLPGHTLTGLLWSSEDGKKRAKYPMVACVDGEEIPLEFALATVKLELERFREACKATRSAHQVTTECAFSQERLGQLLAAAPRMQGDATIPIETRRQFLESGALGPNRLGLLRVTHELINALGGNSEAQTGKSGVLDLRPGHVRVPLCGATQTQGLLMWAAFLRTVLPATKPLLLLSRTGTDWLDVMLGEPGNDELFCLQASTKALPLATDIPYELSPEAKSRLGEWESKFLGTEAPVPTRELPGSPGPTRPPLAKPSAEPLPSAEPRKRRWGMFIGAGALVLVSIAILLVMNSGRKTDPVNPVAASGVRTNPQTAARIEAATNRFAEFMAHGTNFLAVQKFAEAEKQFSEALKLQPNDKDASTLLILTQERARQAKTEAEFSAALEEARRALETDRAQDALTQVKQALQIKPDDSRGLELMTRITQQLQQRAAADKEYQTALAAAQQALRATNLDEATRQAQAALKAKAGDAEATRIIRASESQREELAARDQEYARAIAAAQAALARKDFPAVIVHADQALKLKHEDDAARRLRNDAQEQVKAMQAAQEQEQKYQTAMTAGQDALRRKDYTNAISQADQALKLKAEDAPAKQLKKDAQDQLAATQSKQEQEQKYQLAMTAGQDALRRKDYTNAISQADQALKLKADDAPAKQLKKDAQDQLAATQSKQEQEQKYQLAMTAGQDALRRKDYTNAISQADQALKLKADDAPAKQLKKDAQDQLAAAQSKQEQEQKYQVAMTAGQEAFRRKDYTNAILQAEQALKVKSGDAAAVELKNNATKELAPPSVATSAATSVASYDRRLEVYEVWFRLRKESPSIVANGKPAQAVERGLLPNLRDYINAVEDLRKAYRAAGGLDADREARLLKLDKALREW